MSDPRRRDVLETAGMVVAVGGLAGCADTGQQTDDQEGETPADEPEETQQAGNGEQGALRVAHVSPDAPNVDIYVDGEPVIEDLSFGEVSPYAALDPGTYEVAVTAAEDEDTVVFDEEIDLDAGVARTAVAFGEAAGGPDTGFQIELLDDDLTDPGEEMSRLRLFHAVPDAGAVDVVVVEGPEGGDDDQPVDEPLAEVGVGGELGVEVERLLVHRHVAEALIVGFGDGAPLVVFDGLPQLELLVVASGHTPTAGTGSKTVTTGGNIQHPARRDGRYGTTKPPVFARRQTGDDAKGAERRRRRPRVRPRRRRRTLEEGRGSRDGP